MSRVKPPELKKEGQREGLVILANWFPQWWGWHSPPQETSTSANPTIEEQILDALADTVENNTLLRRDTVFGQFNFTLKQGTFNICNDSRY
jgi:vacuolar protein sorting-associated protein 13D